ADVVDVLAAPQRKGHRNPSRRAEKTDRRASTHVASGKPREAYLTGSQRSEPGLKPSMRPRHTPSCAARPDLFFAGEHDETSKVAGTLAFVRRCVFYRRLRRRNRRAAAAGNR